MRLSVIAVGRLKAGPERELVSRYLERGQQLGRSMGFKGPEIAELDESRARDAAQRMSDEADAIRRIRGNGGKLICFDERGQSVGSEIFASQLGRWRDEGVEAAHFCIGGADGFAQSLRQEAAQVLCLGAMTWPHQIVRVLVLEQIYRAMTILAGHPYHRV